MFKRILIIAMTVIVTVVSTGCGGSSSSSSSSSGQCAEPGCTNTPKAGSSFCRSHQNVANAVKNGYFD
jgi:ABC-type phosphate/phosphonate transport system substrate-binding protein